MFPAFEDWRAAARFAALLLVLLLLPVILARIGLPPRSEVYNGLRLGGGPYVKTRQQLFATQGDIDIAFVGSSILNVAVNADELQSRLEERYGPNVNVRMFGYVFQGYDMQYVMMRDVLEHRRVKMLVMSFSGPRYISDRPHVQLHNVLRWGDYSEMLDGLRFADRASIYASCVLDGPRQLVKFLRLERPIDAADSHRSLMVHESVPEITAAPAPAVLLSDATRDQFMFGEPEMTDRQRLFAIKIAELAAQHHVALVVLNIPTPEEFAYDRIWERADWRHLLAGDPTVVAFRRSDLFGQEPASRFFADSVHMNAEAQERFTRSLDAYLMTRYEELTDR
jgi:hypothetical protein